MSVDQILALLADGAVHSGEELGRALGISRTAVWKQLKKLDGYGIQVQTVKGRGYRLENGLELFDRAAIDRHLSASARELLGELDLCGSVDSTNTRVLQRAQNGGAHGVVCLAEHQSAGRGRHGRAWISPYGRNIYLSAVWEFGGGAAALEGLSLVIGVAIVRALQALGIDDVQLKWPNDVWWQEQKLAGILLEMTGDAAGPCQVVVGVGINVAMLPAEAAAIDQAWASVASIRNDVSRNRLAAELINQLLPILANFEDTGFAPYHEAWEAANGLRGREVEVRVGDAVSRGVVAGVNAAGALRLQGSSGEQLFYGGEASLRQADAAKGAAD